MAWLIKENDIGKDDYSLHIEKTNQTTIIGLDNKTLEEDYYSLTGTNQTTEDNTSPTKQSLLVWTTRHLSAGIPNQEGPFYPSYGIKGGGRDSIRDCDLSSTRDLNGIPSSPNISIPSNGIQAMK